MVFALVNIVYTILWVIELLVLGAVIASWVNADPSNIIVRFLRATTEPLFRLVRPLARKIPGGLDWSPALVLLAIELIKRFVL